MLTISKPLSGGQARSYHGKEFANSEQNDYSQKGAVQGEWTGKLTAEMGLEGAVTAAEFERLAEGQLRTTGEEMVERRVSRTYTNEKGETVTTAEHRAGWDATFSVPKSVSISPLVDSDSLGGKRHGDKNLRKYLQGNLPRPTPNSQEPVRRR